MGKVTKTWDAPPKEEVSGPFSIITGANLIKRKPPTLRERGWRWWGNLLNRRAP